MTAVSKKFLLDTVSTAAPSSKPACMRWQSATAGDREQSDQAELARVADSLAAVSCR